MRQNAKAYTPRCKILAGCVLLGMICYSLEAGAMAEHDIDELVRSPPQKAAIRSEKAHISSHIFTRQLFNPVALTGAPIRSASSLDRRRY